MEYFANEKCDICIIETGLGGRLDATNVIEPILSVITNISLEHTAMLGDTVEEIAIEKGGIIKPTIPVVLGDTQLHSIFEEIANRNNSNIYYSTDINSCSEFQSPLLGDYQKENLRTVLKSCDLINSLGFKLNNDSIQRGLDKLSQNTGFFGRLQVMNTSPLTIFDVSHNPAGILTSIKTIQKLNKGKLHIVYGTSADKDVFSILKLFPKDACYYFTEFSNNRSIKIDSLKPFTAQIQIKECSFFTDPKKALKKAQHQANHEDTIVVIGSFFLISGFF